MTVLVRLSVLLVSMLFISGCATAQKSLQPEQIAKINRIQVSIADAGPDMKVLDHTEARNQTLGTTQVGAQYGAVGGALGGLFEGIIIAAQANYQIKQSLGGDPNIVAKAASNVPVQDIIFARLVEKLSPSYDIVRVSEQSEAEKAERPQNTALLRMNLAHGLAAYTGEPASAGIDAKVEVVDSTGQCMVRTRMQSDRLFKRGRSLTEFAKNDAQAYKSDLEEAANSIVIQIASIFGLESPELANLVVEGQCVALFTTCGHPYRLSQDCSNFSGATRTIQLNGQKLKIAGTEDGKTVLVMTPNYVGNSLADSPSASSTRILVKIGSAQKQ